MTHKNNHFKEASEKNKKAGGVCTVGESLFPEGNIFQPDVLNLSGRVLPLGVNNYEDMENVRKAMQTVGNYPGRPKSWYTGSQMDYPLRASIEDFQRRSGLTVDGVLKPGGETEQAINKELESKRNSSPKYIKMKVGFQKYICDQDKLTKNMVRTLKQSKEARERAGMFILPIDNTIAEQLPGVGTIRSAVTLGNFLGTARGIDKAVQESCWKVKK